MGRAPHQGSRVIEHTVVETGCAFAHDVKEALGGSGIPYRYEAEFPVPEEHREKEGKRYQPDFYLPDEPED